MKSSTKIIETEQSKVPVECKLLMKQDWESVTKDLEIDLERTARETQALQRVREIKTGADLLRLVLFYSTSEWSLRMTAAWALLHGIADMSDVAVMKRIANCKTWLGILIVLLLRLRCNALHNQPGVRLRLIDATVITRQGSKGTDWRVHLSFDLGQMCLDEIEITDQHGGESLVRFERHADTIGIADRAYSRAKSIGPWLEAGAGVIVRANWYNLPMQRENGQPFDIIPWLKTLSEPSEQQVWVNTPQGRFPVRFIACPLPPKEAAQARDRARKLSCKKQHKIQEETLLSAGFLLLVTNLPAEGFSPNLLATLYRIRWQVELAIKRLKSILHLDELRAQKEELVQSFLLGKLLAALLIDVLVEQLRLQAPHWFISLNRPVSLWRVMQFFWNHFCRIIQGPSSLDRFFECLPRLQRYFCDSPRARPQMLAWARCLLDDPNFSRSFVTR